MAHITVETLQGVMMFKATFNNISSHWQTLFGIEYTSPWTGFELIPLVMIDFQYFVYNNCFQSIQRYNSADTKWYQMYGNLLIKKCPLKLIFLFGIFCSRRGNEFQCVKEADIQGKITWVYETPFSK